MEGSRIVESPYKVSIIMPSLNVVNYIDECMKSALDQTLFEKEIICIDAGSTDGTWEKLLFYANSLKRKVNILLFQCKIKSYGYQVNLGIQAASGKYIAILETDDYADPDMYNHLYNVAVTNNADFAKADYDTFVTYSGNKRIFNTVSLFKNEKYKYGIVLNPRNNTDLYINDHTIWRGIYKRDFLISNNILLNESKGAAFQDIGFSLQVLSAAKRVIYIDKSFYRYRLDREHSSINSTNGLKYSYWEFSWLLENNNLRGKLIYIDGIFAFLVQTFCFELVKALRAENYNADSKYIKPYYIWFKNQILNVVNKKTLNINLFQLYPQLHFILENVYEFSLKLKSDDIDIKRKKEWLLNAVKGREIILFGLGAYGNSLIEYLFNNDINIHALCDNNAALWNTEKYGLHVYSPIECTKIFPDNIYIIANKNNSQDIQKQLLVLGINEKNIYIYL